MPSQPPLDPAIVSSERPTAVYSRAQLLALYSSPLVPNKLDGMKELQEWHGEVLPPPSPPQARASLNARSSHGERANSERSSRRLHAADSSPFANFGRFGVDGGLSGEADAASVRNRRGAKGAFATASSGEQDKDTAPHLLSRDRNAERGDRLRSRTGLDETPRRNAGGGGGDMTESGRRRGLDAGGSSRDAPDSQARRDARRGLGPADEGGWRNVGMTREEREKRLARNHNSSTTDSPASRREGGAFGARTGRPAWMDDSASERRESGGGGGGGGGSPAWMDAPSTGKLSFDADGKARASPEDTSREKRNAGSKAPRQRELETYTPTGGAGANGGMDGMQMFKAQMKEREKRERERDLRAKGLPIESDEPASSPSRAEEPAAAPQSKSIFEDLGIARAPPGLGSPSPAAREPVEGLDQGRGGGRSSRFAKFFDGKPAPAPAEASTNSTGPASIFESLMGAGGNGSNGPAVNLGQVNAPSKEDADSMARLLGMLQVSGKRGASPGVPTKGFEASVAMAPLPPGLSKEPANSYADAPSPASLPAQSASRGEEEAGRTKSRFKFSNPPPASSQGPQGQHPMHASLQSPFVAAAHPPPGLASPARSRAPNTEGTTSSSNGPPPQSPRSARAPETIMSPPPAPGGLPSNSFSPPPPGGLAHPQQPFFGHGGPPPPSSQPPFSPPPNGPDGRFLAHQGPGPGPLPGPNQPPRPNMAQPPPFGFGPDGRPIPPLPHLGFLPSFGVVNMPPQGMPPGGTLSPALASPPVVHSPGGGLRGPPSQFPFPGHGQMPPPPPHLVFPPPHFNPGHMPLPPPPQGGPNQPSPLMNLGGNAGADLMALLNSGAGGQRIGANGPPNGVQVRQG